MKQESYRGYTIRAFVGETESMDNVLHFRIERQSDKRELVSSFEDVEGEMLEKLKKRIDNELQSHDPWGEKEAARVREEFWRELKL